MGWFSSTLGPFRDLYHASFSRGAPPGFVQIDDASWRGAEQRVRGLPDGEIRDLLEDLRRAALRFVGPDRAATFRPTDQTLRWVLTLFVAHGIALSSTTSDTRSDDDYERELGACINRLFEDGALIVHERICADMGPFCGVFMFGPYVLRLSAPIFALAPVRWVADIPGLGITVALILGMTWLTLAYLDWCMAGLFLVGYLSVDRLLGPSTSGLRRYERAWGTALLGASVSGRRELRALWRNRRERADIEDILHWVVSDVAAMQLRTANRVAPPARPWLLRVFGPARILCGLGVFFGSWFALGLHVGGQRTSPDQPTLERGRSPIARTSSATRTPSPPTQPRTSASEVPQQGTGEQPTPQRASSQPLPAIPTTRSKPPAFKEWSAAALVNSEPDAEQAPRCFLKVQREWLKAQCEGRGMSLTPGHGYAEAEKYEDIKPDRHVDIVMRLRQGIDATAVIDRAEGAAVLTVRWPQGAPQPVWIGMKVR